MAPLTVHDCTIESSAAFAGGWHVEGRLEQRSPAGHLGYDRGQREGPQRDGCCEGVAQNRVDSAIVRAVIDLANAMGISALAEGVETEEQVAGLKMLGCQVAQGFYFSRPLGAAEFDDLLTRHFAPAVQAGGVLSPDGTAEERVLGSLTAES